MTRYPIIQAKMIQCLHCDGKGETPWVESGEQVGRICSICCSYGTLDGGYYDWTGKMTAALRIARTMFIDDDSERSIKECYL